MTARDHRAGRGDGRRRRRSRPGGQFVVYANVVDPGVSGIAWVTDERLQRSRPAPRRSSLSPCSSGCTIGGHDVRLVERAAQTANAGLAQGTQSFGVWGQDNAGNLGATASHSVDRRLDQADRRGRSRRGLAAPATAGCVRSAGSLRGVRKGDRRRIAGERHRDADRRTSRAVTPGQTAVALPTCTTSCTVGGVTYTYKSAALTAGSLADGSKSFSVDRHRRGGELRHVELHGHRRQHGADGHGRGHREHLAELRRATPSRAATYVVYANAADTGGMATVTAERREPDRRARPRSRSRRARRAAPRAASPTPTRARRKTAGAAIAAGRDGVHGDGDRQGGERDHRARTRSPWTRPGRPSRASPSRTRPRAPSGCCKKSGAYIVYANASDPTGISSVKANVSTITSGQTALALSACATACTVGGVTYGYKSASKTAGSTLAAGAVSLHRDRHRRRREPDRRQRLGHGRQHRADRSRPRAIATTVDRRSRLRQPGPHLRRLRERRRRGERGLLGERQREEPDHRGRRRVAMPVCASACTAGAITYGYTSATADRQRVSISAGSKSYTITVTDQAGNATSASPTVTVDNTAPTVAITFPTAAYSGGWSAGCSTPATADICGTASDATSGVVGRAGEPAPGRLAEHVLEPDREPRSRRRPRC